MQFVACAPIWMQFVFINKIMYIWRIKKEEILSIQEGTDLCIKTDLRKLNEGVNFKRKHGITEYSVEQFVMGQTCRSIYGVYYLSPVKTIFAFILCCSKNSLLIFLWYFW